jgi:hypothetical protein
MPRWTTTVLLGLLTLPVLARADGKREQGSDLARYDAQIKPADRQHWAYQPVKRPAVPRVKDAAWPRNPVDAFVLAKLEAEGWRPSPPAAPHALLRRLHLGLTGLSPTPEELAAFLKHPTPEALDRVAEELLARPAYGEKWARHWLDVARYAETSGYERDATKPHVWRYRDWVIRAFNSDKPFDRFVLEQLAGDELPDADADSLIATGFHRLGPWDDEPADPKEDRFDQLDDVVSTTSLAFLGLTVGCARCHDHKFEALTMHDYYRLVAVFNGLQRPTRGRTELDLPAGSRRQIETQARRDRLLRLLARLALEPRLALLRAPVSAGVRFGLPDLPRGYFLHESARPPETHLLLRGKAIRPGPKVEPGVPAVLVAEQPRFPPPRSGPSLRRLTLARWIANPDNPLTARVIVNRVWQWHFGEGLVRTPSDFGVMGDAPTHPELLDWLADEFVRGGWSLRRLHRLITSSNAYRMSKRWRAEPGKADPDNRLLWRFPYRRLEVEAIRDSMLAVSGRLNAKMYGPSMYPSVPKEALAGHSDPDKIWKPLDEREASRRTVYAFLKRSLVVPLLEALDLCDTTRSAERRLTTTTAPQALSLFNGEFVNRQARHLAGRLVREAGEDPGRQVERAYLLALCRPPTSAESAALVEFLRREADGLTREGAAPGEARRRALEQVCRVILNLNEFVYPD